MNKIVLAMIAAGLVTLATAAQQAKRGAAMPLQRADANGDGEVTWAEVQNAAPRFTRERFNKLDRNSDGVLSNADAPQQDKRPQGQMPQGEQLTNILRRADANGDREVTKEELAAVAPRLARAGFARLDLNKDGVITEADRANNDASAAPSPEAVRKADANGDGFWSYEELKTVAKQLPENAFKRVDSDGDGLLNAQELQALRRMGNQPTNPRRGNALSNAYRTDSIAKMLKLDANGDGSVTFEELAAAKPGYPRVNFDRNDRNNDGVVSAADRP